MRRISATVVACSAPSAPAPLIYYAGQAGRLTSDRDAAGGNPFATALVEVLKIRPLTLKKFTEKLAYANAIHSRGWQQMDYPFALPDPKRRLDKGDNRVALVLINADYSKSDAYSLPGARFDAKRVPAALIEAGFTGPATVLEGDTVALDPVRAGTASAHPVAGK